MTPGKVLWSHHCALAQCPSGITGLWAAVESVPIVWITRLCKPCMGECMSPPPKADKILPQTIDIAT